MLHTHTQFFWKFPLEFLVLFRTQKGGHCARCSLRRRWKLGLRIVAWSEPHMLCEEILGKRKIRAFPRHVNPQILLLESVDYLRTSEHYWVVLIGKIAMVGSHACFAKKSQERWNLELFWNMLIHEFYHLKALITLEPVNTTEWSKKNRNLNCQNCHGRML